MKSHSLLSPSSAHRWLHCTASPLLEAQVEDKGSSFAEEGTLAHAYCAKKLKSFFGHLTVDEDREIAALSHYHTGEMDEHTDQYVSLVLQHFNAAKAGTPDAKLLIEERLDFSSWVPDGFGTGDAIIIADDVLEVIDFKYGKGVEVSAVGNEQMRIYALGAYDRFSLGYSIRTVRMTIVQPRLDNISEDELTAFELLRWADTVLTPAAVAAYNGHGELEAGSWCKFCRVKGCCRALSAECLNTASEFSEPRLLTADELAESVLPYLDTVKTWLKGVEEYALQQALSGVHLKGYKLVEGRSARKISDPDAVASTLGAAGFASDAYMKPAELRGLTDLERIVGKKRFCALCSDYIYKPHGKPTLAPDSDKRKPMDLVSNDFQDFD